MDFAAARLNMVESQVRTVDVTDPRLTAAMHVLPREAFTPASHAALAYADAEIPLAPGRIMLRPSDLARLIQVLAVQATDRALVIGAGTGYGAALMAELAAETAAVESITDLVGGGRAALSRSNARPVRMVEGTLEAPPVEGPFDVILIDGGSVHQVPQAWLDLLADKGRLAVVVREGAAGRAHLYTRSGQTVAARIAFDAMPPALAGFAPKPGFVF